MHLGTKIYTFLFGKLVGSDEFGNKYYESRKIVRYRKKLRWVVYKGLDEPSKVPPAWHLWLHYSVDDVVKDKKYSWQQRFLPNLTGTEFAHFPPGHLSNNAEKKIKPKYEAWKP